MIDIMFILAHGSLVLICFLLVIIIRARPKTILRRYFLFYLIDLFIWTFGILGVYYMTNLGYPGLAKYFDNISYFGVAFIAVAILMVGRSFGDEGTHSMRKVLPLFIVPTITQIVVWTNPLHNFFFKTTGQFAGPDVVEVGWYFYVHTVYSYGCILLGIIFMIRFALQSKGNSSIQAVLVVIGTIIPIVINVCFTLNIGNFTVISTPVAFMITTLTYLFGTFRFNLFRAAPIALRTVVNNISDLYVVIDEDMNILDFNKPFYDIFSPLADIRENGNLLEALSKENQTGLTADDLIREINLCKKTKEILKRDYELPNGDETSYYSVEFTPMIIEDKYCGCIVLLRDMTRAVNDMNEIEKNHRILIERERLASLGQLIGGIAHNLKTPIMAISGRAESLWDLIDEYEKSLTDASVTLQDHREIAGDMREQIVKMKTHMDYITDIINAVKDQTIQFDSQVFQSFTIGDLMKRLNILMHHELVRFNCELITEILVDDELEIAGDINSMIQVLDNIIVNAIHAYKGESGKIWLRISRTPNTIIFSIKDEAGGIDKDVQNKLFKQMTTTKGKDGTGLGLYITFSTVVGKFSGKLWFESVEGEGTEFFISLPFKY